MLGARFTVQAGHVVTVRGLGFFDEGANGLAAAAQVGLWTDAGALLGSVTVPTGTAAPMINNIRYQMLGTPVVLNPGTYRVAGLHTSGGNPYMWTTAPVGTTGITPNGGCYAGSTTFVFPNTLDGTNTYYGATILR